MNRAVEAVRDEAFVEEQRQSGSVDPDIVNEALRTGATGYVVKSDAESELIKAIEASLRSERFVSTSAKGSILEDADNPD